MNDHELAAIGRALDRLGIYEPVLDIGSRDINGTIRPLLPDGVEYVGVDREPGPNVDNVVGLDLSHACVTASFGTVVCNSTLEHDPTFFDTVREIYRVARPGATIVIGVPAFGVPYHPYPVDCYRFSEDAFHAFLLEGCCERVVERFGPDSHPRLCGSGSRA